jgi:3-dehydroquinate synthase
LADNTPQEKICVKSSMHNYEIFFGSYSDDLLGSVMIIDANVKDLYFKEINNGVHIITSSEENKNIESVLQVLDYLITNGLNKTDLVTVVGGGVVQDIATLAVSIFKRGIVWKFVPTTLQAMMDSCIGGKSSINYGGAKNILGNFFPPTEIAIDANYLSTLKEIDIVCGLIEGAKICAASGLESLNQFLSKANLLSNHYEQHQKELWDDLIKFVLLQKRDFVEIDEFDIGIRRLLNFGHTFGHALEASTDFAIPHGVAVGIGILISSEFSENGTNAISAALNPFLESILEPVIFDFKTPLNTLNPSRYLSVLGQDKKGEHGHYNFIVPTSSGLGVSKELICDETNQRILNKYKMVVEKWCIS